MTQCNYGTEKRLFPRYPAHSHFKIEFLKRSIYSSAVLKNISASGIGFETRRCILSEEHLILMFECFHQEGPLFLTAKVVWARTQTPNLWSIGAEFVNAPLGKVRTLCDALNITL